MKKTFELDEESIKQLKYVKNTLRLDDLNEALGWCITIGATMTAIHSRVAEAKFKELLQLAKEEKLITRLEKAWEENKEEEENK